MFGLNKKINHSFCPDTFRQMCIDAYIMFRDANIGMPRNKRVSGYTIDSRNEMEWAYALLAGRVVDEHIRQVTSAKTFSLKLGGFNFKYEGSDIAEAAAKIGRIAFDSEHETFFNNELGACYRTFKPTINHTYNEETNMVTVWVS